MNIGRIFRLEHTQTDTVAHDVSRKFIPYGRQWIDNDDVQAVIDVLKSDWLTQGPGSREFEKKFAEYCGSKYAVSVTSGTAALHLACLAAEAGQGDEIITSPITFAASSNCALYVGAAPVFLDIDPETICLDHRKLKDYLNSSHDNKAKAIIPVHFAGLPCNMEEISQSARDNGLVIIEDACHALGAEYGSQEQNKKTTDRVKVGSCKYSDMTVFSFHPVKHITTGEGGMITTNNTELYEKLLMLRTHGITKKLTTDTGLSFSKLKESQITAQDYYYEMQRLGFNYRLTDIQCALGISQLKKLDIFLERRKSIADYYNDALRELEDYIIFPPDDNGNHAWHLYVIQLKTGGRDEVFKKLRENGIGVQVHYIPVYFHPYYRMMGYKERLCPHAEDYFHRAITLPLYPSMDRGDMERVVEEVFKAVKGGS